jgi:REP element-mobilizing transposase RayT
MPQSLVRVLVHIVFSTKNRENLILPEYEPGLYSYITGVVRNQGSRFIIGNGIEDHVHILASLGRTTDVATLIGAIKRGSSRWMKEEFGLMRFAWQSGYGAFSVSRSQEDSVIGYIANQKEHHRVQTFQEEFLELLRLHEVEYDERYLWD